MTLSKISNGKKTFILLFAVLSLNAACAMETKNAANKSAPFVQSYTWYDGEREQQVWLNPQLIAEFNPTSQGEQSVKRAYPAARIAPVKRPQPGIRLWQVESSAGAMVRSLKAAHPQGKYSPVLHDGPSGSGRMRALPGNIIVYFDPQWDEAEIHTWLDTHKLEVVKKLEIGPNIYLIKTGPGLEALDAANTLYRSNEVKAAFPDWWQEVVTR